MYEVIQFSDCDITDPFFESLKADYPGFSEWFNRKAEAGTTAYVSKDGSGIQAFVYTKIEDEPVGDLGSERRMKIGTFKVSEGSEKNRLGEGGIGLVLWEWQKSDVDQIYLTVFPKHEGFVRFITRFGFMKGGCNSNGEMVYYKDKKLLSYADLDAPWYKAFPYLDSDFRRGVYIPIKAAFHDNMFRYSELRNTDQHIEPAPVANGITKVYVATPYHFVDYRPGDIALIYRISNSDNNRGLTSVVTSFCTVAAIEWIKKGGKLLDGKSWDGFVHSVGNKTVYDDDELKMSFSKQQVCLITLVYNGFFGEGCNVNNKWLRDHGLFETHPYENKLTPEQVREVLHKGGKDDYFTFIHKT